MFWQSVNRSWETRLLFLTSDTSLSVCLCQFSSMRLGWLLFCGGNLDLAHPGQALCHPAWAEPARKVLLAVSYMALVGGGI